VTDVAARRVITVPRLGQEVMKRALDVTLASALFVVAGPVLLLLCCLVRLTSTGPALFRQERVGRDMRPFTMLKLRSMYVGNDDLAHRAYVTGMLSAAEGASARHGGLFKLVGDRRITPIGAWLRRTSLDELPQLLNVLQGNMSLVGPRPHAVAHNDKYAALIDGYCGRHRVQPGITGWAQISGYRGETDTLDKMAGRVKHDLAYIENWSILLDLKIIAKTAIFAPFDSRAY
jgi:putative colanic acid biosysnthesis UDP-glucose lipid carrier transferase